jgi:flavin reductase (DIM6/NTAB) family NADH-FMN oxidoreductase RutF
LSVSPDEFRRTLGSFASGVTVMTALGDDSRPVGVTVSAFSSLSLDPPLVLFCLDKRTAALAPFTEGHHFVVNILADDQRALSDTFAAPETDRFAGVAFETWESGCPVLPGAMANLECRREAVHEGGDHLIIVGRVERVAWHEGRCPLVYAQGAYRQLVE